MAKIIIWKILSSKDLQTISPYPTVVNVVIIKYNDWIYILKKDSSPD